MNAADETQRTGGCWILQKERLSASKIIDDALKSGLSGNELQEFLAKKCDQCRAFKWRDACNKAL